MDDTDLTLPSGEQMAWVSHWPVIPSAEAMSKPAGPVSSLCCGAFVRRFGTIICQERKARLLSGPSLAALAGIGKGHLSKIENHRCNVSLDTIVKLANALQLTPAILMHKCSAPND